MNREEARDAGHIHYDGKPCVRCSATRRYASTNDCVACRTSGHLSMAERHALAAHNRALRDTAVLYGQRRYHGGDCAQKHGGERYTSSGECVACRKLMDRNRPARIKSAPRQRSTPVEVIFAPRPNPTPAVDGWVSCITPPTKAMMMGRRAP
jgi:hypothetical protein